MSLLTKVGQLLGKTGPVSSSSVTSSISDSSNAILRLMLKADGTWKTNQLAVQPEEANLRLDRLITSKFDLPRSLLHKLLRKNLISLERPGNVQESNELIRIPPSCSIRVQPGDIVSLTEVFLREKQSPQILKLEDITAEKQEDLQNLILYKDENLIVINKPAGLAVHGGPGTEEHLEKFLEAFRFEASELPKLVHRLDKETSGVLVLARNRATATMLSERLQSNHIDKTIKKIYWAMVNGTPPVMSGRIVTNIYKSENERMTSIADSRSDVLDDGKVSITRFRNAGQYIKSKPKRTKLAMLEMEPLTGRTHQLRVHAAEQLGTPIVGDRKYSRHHLAPGPLHLHARKLVLKDYPEKGKFMTFQAPLPSHFVRTMNQYPLFLRTKPKFPKKKAKNLRNRLN